MFVIIVILEIIIVGGMIVGLYQKNTNLFCKSKRRLDGKTAIIIGGTAGMGLEIAVDFAHRGAKVIVACPFEDEGLNAKKTIIRSSENENVIFKHLDLASLESVRKFASNILLTEERLDLLINNAGVGIPGDFLTKDGLNFVMQVNYFGIFLVTNLLLPLLKKTGTSSEPTRIVNTSSVMHNFGRIDFQHLNSVGYWYRLQIYGNSKLCLILFTRELAKRLEDTNVIVNVVDPGAVGTQIFRDAGVSLTALIIFLIATLFKTPWEGAQTAIYVAMSLKAGKVSGKYFKNCQIKSDIRFPQDDEQQKRLWEESIEYVKLRYHELTI
ncbi:retinol dehydrogenase 13-like [Aphomia sociella]